MNRIKLSKIEFKYLKINKVFSIDNNLTPYYDFIM